MPRPKPAAPKGKEKRQAIQKDKVDVRESTRAKVDELLAQPLSAFVMFGFAQRNLLKKQKPNATPKEVVKAIGACSCRLARDARDHALMRAQAIAGSSWPRRSDKSTRSSVNSPAAPPCPRPSTEHWSPLAAATQDAAQAAARPPQSQPQKTEHDGGSEGGSEGGVAQQATEQAEGGSEGGLA